MEPGDEFPSLTRRRFMTLASGALAASTVFPILQACSPSSQQTAKSGGTLRIVSGETDGPAGTVDPAFSTSDPDATRIALVYERLVILDDGFAPQPQLATSWQSNETGDSWTFKLRSGVKFHDGSVFTAQDVVYSYQRLLDPATGSPAAAQLSNLQASGIKALDAQTVQFALSSPDVDLPSTIANRFTFIVKSGMSKDQLRTTAVGTGPFKLQQFVPNQQPNVFVKNQSYWQPGIPKVDTIQLRAIPEEASRISALESGQVDIIWDMTLSDAQSLSKLSSIRVSSLKTPFIINLACWCDTPPFTDVRVRQAMKYAVDRNQIERLMLGPYGAVGNDDPVAPWVLDALVEQPRKQDIAQAKALLAAAGFPNGVSVDLYTSDATAGMVQLATIFQQQAAPAGINVNIKQADPSSYWDNIWLKQPFVASSWSGRAAIDALATPYLSTSQWNETHWYNSSFDALIKKAQGTVDPAARKTILEQAQKMVIDEGGALIPIFVDALSATRSNVTGWKLGVQKFYKDFRNVSFA